MQRLGWIDEGVRFCAVSAGELAVKSFAIGPVDGPSKIRPAAACQTQALNVGPCIAVNNLPVPNQLLTLPTTFSNLQDASILSEFYGRSGVPNTTTAFVPAPAAPLIDSARNVFVQQAEGVIGIHVDTRERGASAISNVSPLYQMRTTAGPGLRDDRFFPFAASESEVELQVSFTLTVQLVNMRSAGGGAYGHPTVQFLDTKSGRYIDFNVLAYGTVPQTDYLALDAVTGHAIVGTVFGPNASYGRSLGAAAFATPSGFDMRFGYGPANHGDFDLRLSRDEFGKVLASARTVDPSLSADPADYMVDNFHFRNEVAGDGELGAALQGFRVRLLRRGAGFIPS